LAKYGLIMKEKKMHLTVNGKKMVIGDKESFSISRLLYELNVADPLYVTVELNGDIMERINFDSIMVKDGGEIEFLYFMGGGRGSC
jgi:sulfur carrier protein